MALLFALALGCGSSHPSSVDRDGRTAETNQRFESSESILLDFDIDGQLVTDTSDPAAVRTLIQAQFLYTVGPLNADRSLGRLERLDLSDIRVTPNGARSFSVAYHAKLPVAWGSPTRPTTYGITVPARVGEADQIAFAAKYGKTCVDPTAGDVAARRMFLDFRPNRVGCALEASDVVTLQAKVSPSSEMTTGKYPEYQRVWEDGALDVVALFSRSSYELTDDEDGVRSFQTFVARADALLRERQPDDAKRTAESPRPYVERRAATLPDGRKVRIDATLVGPWLAQEGPELDAWYDALTPEADLVVYSGHAGHGDNVRALMKKGTFAPKKYLVWVVNGCDTFAYVDRTLADRRAAVNPDDPSGTKYMDTVSTVLGGYFSSGAATTMTFVDAMLAARDVLPTPRTYREVLAGIDPEQVTVVTGEEDNTFEPSMFAPTPAPNGNGGAAGAAGEAPAAPAATPTPGDPEVASSDGGGSCGVVAAGVSDRSGVVVVALAIAAVLGARRNGRAKIVRAA